MKKLLIVLLLILGGCSSIQKDVEPLPLTDDRYEFLDNHNQEQRLPVDDYELAQEIRITDGTIVDLAEFYRTKTNKTLVSNATDTKISGLFSGSPRQIARQVSLAYDLIYAEFGDVIYLVSDNSDKTLNVSAALVCDLAIDDLKELFPDLSFIRRDNMIVCNGDFFRVKQIQDYLAVLNQVEEQNYVVTVVEVETSLDFALTLQMEIASKGVDLLKPNISAYDVFSALARVNGQALNADNYHERQLVVTSGQKSTYSRSTEKKLEQRAISDQGTSTVTGYETVSAGVILELNVNSFNDDFVELAYNLELSSFVGASLDKTSVKAQSDKVLVKPNSIYYLASSEDRRREKSLLFLGAGASKEVVVSSIFVKIDKIAK